MPSSSAPRQSESGAGRQRGSPRQLGLGAGRKLRTPLSGHLRRLLSHSAVYGAADVFTTVVNFLLVPLYTAFLGPADYGHLALLFLLSTVAKIVFRLGLDGAFFRVHYLLDDEASRRRLAGTVALFSALVSTVLFAVVVSLRATLHRVVLGGQGDPRWVALAALDVYLGAFAFVPLSLLRIQDRPGLFSTFSALRHAVNIALKVVLVARGWGVTGVLWSDAIATAVFSLALSPVLFRHAALAFSWPLLREALAFGVPKVPHGLLVQAQNLADRWILDLFVTRAEVGLYQMAYTFGTGVKFALSAFEPAWGPFVFAQARREDAPLTIARVVTYAWAAFVAAFLGVAVLGRELLVLMTPKSPAFWAAAPVVPVVALAYLLHGAFLLTSVGLAIERKTGYYPLVTLVAASANVAANFALVPRYGMLGSAWATVLSYAVMALLGFVFSRSVYPIPFEAGRLLRVTLAAAAVFAASCFAPEPLGPAIAVKAALLAAFPALLVAVGFLGEAERRWLRALR